jgi:shikimate dehydrogenase
VSYDRTPSPDAPRPAAPQTADILVGLIGLGIGASGSPALHMEEAAALGLNLRYTLFDLDHEPGGAAALERLLKQARQAGYAGVNITHPCKQQVIALLDELSEDARALGAVNTVVFGANRCVGHNTDWWGFAEGFRRGLSGVGLRQVAQLGAGGAGSAVAYAMLKMGTQRLTVFDIDRSRAESMIETLAPTFGRQRLQLGSDLEQALAQSDGIINATPIGMDKYPGVPVPVALLRPDHWVAEIIYFPLETALLQAARALGCRTVDGGGMAVFQAAEAFRLFTGVMPDALRMLAGFRRTIVQ